MHPKFLSLEGLRGSLALLVCLCHLGLIGMLASVGVHLRFFLAVDIFFALSGFVLCHTNYLGRRTLGDFTVGRIARLYPLHLLTVLIMIGLAVPLGWKLEPAHLVQELLTLHNIGLPPYVVSLNDPNWSVSVEMWVSLAFFLLLTRWRLLALLGLALTAPLVLGAELGNVAGAVDNVYTVLNRGVVRGLSGFAVGALAYHAYQSYGDRLKVSAPVSYLLLVALVVLMIAPDWTALTALPFYAVVFSLLIALAANDKATLLSTRPLVWLGTVSYSLYLLHMVSYWIMVLLLGESRARGSGKILVIALAILVSQASYRWFEVPSQRFILNWWRTRKKVAAAASPMIG